MIEDSLTAQSMQTIKKLFMKHKAWLSWEWNVQLGVGGIASHVISLQFVTSKSRDFETMVLKQEVMKDQIAEQGSHTFRFYCTWNE
jgi:hypothetical protein